MKCTLDFPVSFGQVLYYANHKRNCVDKVFVSHLTKYADGGCLIGLHDTDGDRLRPMFGGDLGVCQFEDEESANCAVLAGGVQE